MKNKKLTILALVGATILSATALFIACGKDDKKKDTPTTTVLETTTPEQVTFVKVPEVTFVENKVTSITYNNKTYAIPGDVKEEYDDSSEYVYVMNDGNVFHIMGDEVYVETLVSEEETTNKVVSNSTEETNSSSSDQTTVEEETTNQETTTKAPETTTKKPEQTTTKKETTTKKQTANKEETTTKKQEQSYKDVSADGRLKNQEMQLISRLKELDRWDDAKGDYVPATLLDCEKDKKYNPYLQSLAWGWENVLAYGKAVLYDAYSEVDDFSVKYPNDSRAAIVERDLIWSKNYLDAIIKDCEAWASNKNKSSAKEFQKYLVSKYTDNGSNSIFTNSYNPDGFHNDEYENHTKEFCEKWCYYDNTDKQYKTNFETIRDFAVYTCEKKGYFNNVNEMLNWISFTGDGTYDENNGYGCKYAGKNSGYTFVRWYYDKNANKTTVYLIFAP